MATHLTRITIQRSDADKGGNAPSAQHSEFRQSADQRGHRGRTDASHTGERGSQGCLMQSDVLGKLLLDTGDLGLQQILGRSNPSVTQRYAHLSSKSLQEAANSASIAISGSGRPVESVNQFEQQFAPSICKGKSCQGNHQQEQEIRGEMFVMGQATALCKCEVGLNNLEVKCIWYLIRTRQPGRYTLRQLVAEHWNTVRSKRSFGRRVKRAVNGGVFSGLELRRRNSSRSLVYALVGAPVAANDPVERIAA